MEAFASHDAKKIMALYADNVVVHAQTVDIKGKEALEKHFVDNLLGMSSDIKLATTRIFWHGKDAVSEWVLAGKNDKDAQVKATNKPFGYKGASHMVFNDEGLITEEWLYFDTLTIMSQLGLNKDLPPVAVVALPTAPPEVHQSKDGDAAQTKNLDVVEKLMAAHNANKEDDMLALKADDASSSMNVLGAPDTKKKDMKAHDLEWTKSFPDRKGTIAASSSRPTATSWCRAAAGRGRSRPPFTCRASPRKSRRRASRST